jgi:hypothetical protein
MLWYVKFKPITQVHHGFRREYGVRTPDDKNIRRWYEEFRERLAVWKNRHSAGWPRRSAEDMDRVGRAFTQSPKKSIS